MANSSGTVRTRLVLLLAVTLVTTVAATGCGGDSGDDSAAPPASSTPGTTTASSTPTPTPTPSATDAPATPADTPTATPPAWASTSVEVSRTPPGQVTLAALRSAHNEENGESFDRLVLEFTGGLPGYRAGYVNQVVQDGSGAPVPLRGQAFFEIVVHPAAAHDDNGAESLVGPRSGGGLPALVEYDLTSDFEGYVQVGVGLDDVVGFRVFELAGPDRLVFDFAS